MEMRPTAPGWYEYVDPTGKLTRIVYVFSSESELIARFPPNELSEGVEVAVARLHGDFRPLGHLV